MKHLTEKLYYTDPNLVEWETEITGAFFDNDKWIITLKETAFYPEGGGQPCDLGTIADIPVDYVYKKDDDEVYHVLREKPQDTRVKCRIDSIRRIENTQHHSGQHLLSATCYDLYGYETISFHLSDQTATIDLNVPTLTEDERRQIEQEVNRRIIQNHPIRTFYIDPVEADKYHLRKVPQGHEKLRIVEIAGIEYNACGGTHVQSTSEIGLLKLLKQEKVRGNTRLYFICGIRLLNDYTNLLTITNDLTKKLTTSADQLVEQVEKLVNENKEQKKKYSLLFAQYSDAIQKDLLDQAKGTLVSRLFSDCTTKEMQIIAAKITKESDKIILLGSLSEGKILLAHNGKSPVHCGQIVKEYIGQYEGKGGGNNKSAQAIFPNTNALESCFHMLQESLEIENG